MTNSARPFPSSWDGQALYFSTPVTTSRWQARQLVTRTDASGAIDAKFALRLSKAASPDMPIRQPDGKYLVSGFFDYVDGVAFTPRRPNFVRLNRDGTLDSSFHAPESTGEDSAIIAVRPVGLQPSGRILASMPFPRRLNADGSLDESFPALTTGVALDGQGYLYTRGPSGPVQRLTPDGAPDPTSAFPAITTNGAYTVTRDGGLVVDTIERTGRKLTWLRRDGSVSGEATYSYSRPGVTTTVLPDASVVVIGDLTTAVINTLAARIYHFDSTGSQLLIADVANDVMTIAGVVHDILVSRGGGQAAVGLANLNAGGRALIVDHEVLALPARADSRQPDAYPMALFRPKSAQEPMTSLAPVIFAPPTSRSIVPGSSTSLMVNAYGAYPRTYQWFKDGVALSEPREVLATSDVLSLPRVQAGDEGSYTVRIVNQYGAMTSQPARVTVLAPPAIALMGPTSLVVAPGQTVALTVRTTGDNLRYFYQKDGLTYADPTLPAFPGFFVPGGTHSVLLQNVTPADAGVYRITVNNGSIGVVSDNITLAVSNSATPSRLANLSVRTQTGTGDESLIVGFVIAGAGTPPALLARGIGPALTGFGVTGVLNDPQLTLRSDTALVATNDNWAGNAQVVAAAVATGAFPLVDPASRDAALYVPALAPGSYTVQISGTAGTSGTALAEIYDAGPAGARPQLVNLSTRSSVTGGGEPLIAGFTIAGSTAKTVLVRAVGASLATFGVQGHVTHGELAIFDAAGRKVAENLTRGAELVPDMLAQHVGAFALQSDANDNAIAITLPPGSYTTQFRSGDTGRGIVLIEIYEVP
jgi:hypothetical protein